jgi:hypothetical protein
MSAGPGIYTGRSSQTGEGRGDEHARGRANRKRGTGKKDDLSSVGTKSSKVLQE